MGKSVQKLDKSGWSAEALARGERFEAERVAYLGRNAALASHPLADVLGDVSAASLDASEAPRFRMIARDFGNGHKECVLYREEPNLQKRLERAIERDVDVLTPRGEGDRDASRAAAVRRAKQKVRHRCKAMGVNSLWTLTWKENMKDRDRAWQAFDRFRRKVAAIFPEWKYIAVLENQTRGAYHVHLATHALPMRLVRGGVKVKSWNVMRAIWRSIAPGGNFDEAKRKGRWGGARSYKGAGAIASYIAGYVAKDMEAVEFNRKRYSCSKGVELPVAYRAMWAGDVSAAELIELAFAAVGDRITRSWWDAEREVFFVESDDSKPG